MWTTLVTIVFGALMMLDNSAVVLAGCDGFSPGDGNMATDLCPVTDCPSGYHIDDKSNCVCNGERAGQSCSSDSDCCEGTLCKNGHCGCITDRWIPVQFDCTHCCTKKCEYWPTYTGTYCT